MGEHILRVALDELTRVRIVCVKCSAAVELPRDKLAIGVANCPGCGHPFTLGQADEIAHANGKVPRFKALADALSDVAALSDRFVIEFPVTMPSDSE